MKRYKPLLLTFLFLPLLFSCFNLEEELYDQLEKEGYYEDYESLMAAVLRPYEHAKWAETEFSFWLQELSADQLVITQKREHWEDGGVWLMIHQHTWDTYERNSEQMWNACYGGIGYCNNALTDIQKLSYDNFGLTETEKRQHIAELTALRAYFQLLLLDAFRIPAISLSTKEEVGSSTPQENFRFIEESLLAAIPDLPKAPARNHAGRLTQGAAAVLLMRLYFNAYWYINIPMWEETRNLCERILNGDFGSYSLATDWTDIWNAGNQDCPELIWSYPQSKKTGYDDFYYLFFMHYNAPELFGNSTDLPVAYNGCHLSPSYDPSGQPYPYMLGCTFSKFPDTDRRKKNFRVTSQGRYEGLFLFGPQPVYQSDRLQYGAEEWGNSPLLFVDQVARYSEMLTDKEKKALVDKQLLSTTPWRIQDKQFASLSSTIKMGEENTGIRIVKYPFYPSGDAALKANNLVVLRLAEVYYTLAESLFRLGNPAKAEALLNQVRQRYYSAEDWERVRYPEDGSVLTFRELLDEWGREFLAEKRRRTDLNRFGLFTSGTWWDKQPSESYRRFYPVPARAISANPLLKRSEGYAY